MSLIERSIHLAAVGAVIGALALAGCGSSSKSSSGTSPTTTSSAATSATTSATTSGSSPACQSVNEFKTSISTLTNPSTYTGGKSSIQTALDSVKTSLNNVKTELKSGDKPKVDALQSSIGDLQKAIDNMSGVSGISAVASAAKNVEQSAQAVVVAAKVGCPSS